MSRVKVTVLTPVHIGSGEKLRENMDFVTFGDADDPYLGILDLNKIVSIIGESAIDEWTASIDRGEPFAKFLTRKKPGLKGNAYIGLAIPSYGLVGDRALKTFIRDGMGLPYIPGSSIKGAIRTAVVSSIPGIENNLSKDGRLLPAKKVEGRYLGDSPNSDVFRFLRVGDAYFASDDTVALPIQMDLNITSRGVAASNNEKAQTVEVLEVEREGTFDLSFDSDSYWRLKNIMADAWGNYMPDNLQDLFKVLKSHTIKLLNDEISFWKDKNDSGADPYIESLEEVLRQSMVCADGSECVIRVGYGSGWLFITGGWSRNSSEYEKLIIPKARPRNERYAEYPFPKSRRASRYEDSVELPGFIKLSIK